MYVQKTAKAIFYPNISHLGKGILHIPVASPTRKHTPDKWEGLMSKEKAEKTKIEKSKRTKRLSETRVTEAELATIKAKAAQAGLTVSEYQRRALIDCVVVERKPIVEMQAVRELSYMNNNLNQLVRKTHIHDETDTEKMRHILMTIDMLIMGLISDS